MRAWRMMGERMDWHALPLLIELLGVQEVEEFVAALCAVRDYWRRSD